MPILAIPLAWRGSEAARPPGCPPSPDAMFTFQILDRGQTLSYTLGDRPLLVGSASHADIRLGDEGVEAEHLRIEPGDPPALVRLGDLPVLRNGSPVDRSEIALGDRVEVGKAVLVFGKTVAERVRPEDLLRERPPRPRRPVSPGGRGRLLALAAALLVVGAAVYLAVAGASRAVDRAAIERLRRRGDFAAARVEVERQRAALIGDPILARELDGERALIDAVERSVAEARQRILGSQDGYADWNLRLQEIEKRGDSEARREAARIVRSSLTDLLRQRPRTGHPISEEPAPPAAAARDSTRGPARAPKAAPAPYSLESREPGAAAPDLIARCLSDARRLRGEGLFAQAVEVLRGTESAVPAESAASLREEILAVESEAAQTLDDLQRRAETLEREGRRSDAIDLLAAEAHRFPSGRLADGLSAAIDRLRRDLSARSVLRAGRAASPVPAEPLGSTLKSLREMLDRVREAEASGDFETAEALLREGADLVALRDPSYAERMRQRADEFLDLRGLHEAAAAALSEGRTFDVSTRSGALGQLIAIRGKDLVIASAGGEDAASWLDLSIESVRRIVADAKLPRPAWLGAAVLAYRNGESAEAEGILARLLRSDPGAKREIDRVIARGRGDAPDPRGYALEKEGFVSQRTIEAHKAAQRLAGRLDSVLRSRDRKVRDEFITDLLSQGPEALESVVLLFKGEFDRQVRRLEEGSLQKRVERLEAQRVLLDQARAEALDLIYDEVRYFYPYRPPAVSGEKAAEYAKVQAEVDRRVAAVRAIWNDLRVKVSVPASLEADLDRLDFVARVLAELGDLDREALASVEWARALAGSPRIDIRTYCRTLAERDRLAEWKRIEEFNARIGAKMPSATREQLAITNAYRVMFARRPLALNPKLVASATGHATEMSRLGYFAHFSPTPGRRTPFDRMKLAGYAQGVSENIALHDGAEGAHDAWCRSSGHHRNLLDQNHTEMGVAALGRYWVQNFGHGREYLEDPLFAGR
ncbi:MAG: hypothetical protein Fur0037_16170 [Planctomycetota bacterium]